MQTLPQDIHQLNSRLSLQILIQLCFLARVLSDEPPAGIP
ncbi:12161_t:CDS:2 [Gigaspora margarita]|uniref:12161_t:CDS:1 n=1 Tax=Gigaspora margarita TaxID=4874 RepID=A0ABN7WJQ4_GIGMA|nr:12161_t:CDS:2 [Gigaspora margarita]